MYKSIGEHSIPSPMGLGVPCCTSVAIPMNKVIDETKICTADESHNPVLGRKLDHAEPSKLVHLPMET